MIEPAQVELIDRLARYLAGEIDLAEFEAWFVPWEWSQPRDEGARRDLAADVLLWLCEYSRGHRAEQELRKLMADRLRTTRLERPASPQTASSATIVRTPALVTARPPGIRKTPPATAPA